MGQINKNNKDKGQVDTKDNLKQIQQLQEKIQIINELESNIDKLKKQLIQSISYGERALNLSIEDKEKIKDLQVEIDNLEKKYERLRNSKLGIITLKVWGLKRKVRR